MFSHPVRRNLMVLLVALGAWRASFAAKPDTWIELRSPNFIVVTNANEKQARHVAYQFEMIRAVFRQVFNIKSSAKDPPVTIIAAKNEDTLKTLLPEYWATKGSMHPAGIYLGGPEKNYVGLRLDVAMSRQAYEPFESVYHEYVHFLTRRIMSQLPLWMTEGLAEFYGNTRIESKRVYVGAPSSSNIIVLRQNPPLPLSTLFGVTASSPYYHEQNKASIFYAGSWALTHYLTTRDWREKTQRFNDFVVLLGQNVAPEEAARRTIGDLNGLEKGLSEYIGNFTFAAAVLNAPPGVDENDFAVQPISEAESLAVRADFMTHDRHYPEAKEMLEEALKLDPKLEAAYENMGFLLTQQGKFDEANKWFSQAVALNSQSYLVNYYYAMNLIKGKFDDDSAGKAESSLRAAIKINPEFAPAFDALGFLLGSRLKNPDEAYRMTLIAVTLEPGNIRYRLNSAQVLEQAGRVDDAVNVIKRAVFMAKTPEEQAEAQAALSNAEQYQTYVNQQNEQAGALKKTEADALASEASQSNRVDQASPSLASSHSSSGAAQDSSKPPVLRRRGEMVSGDSRRLSPGDVVVDHPPRPDLSSRRQVADGTIQAAKCSGTSLEIALDSSNGIMQLYNDSYMNLTFRALNYTPKSILNPCTDMKGWHARISYHPAKSEPKLGEMVAVDLVKN